MGLEEEVAQNDVDRNHGLWRLYDLLFGVVGATAVEHTGRDITVGRNGSATEAYEFRGQLVTDALQVAGVHLTVGIANTGNGCGIERYRTVVLGELQVGPCPDCQGFGVL